MRYTALEILKFAGVEKPNSKFGKFGINIAGVVVNKPDHIVNMQDSTEAKVIVGNEAFTAKLPKQDDTSDEVKSALKAKGEKATESRIASGKVKAPKADKE